MLNPLPTLDCAILVTIDSASLVPYLLLSTAVHHTYLCTVATGVHNFDYACNRSDQQTLQHCEITTLDCDPDLVCCRIWAH